MREESVAKTGREVAEWLASDTAFRERLVELARVKFRLDLEASLDVLQETAVILLSTIEPIRNPDGFAYRVFHTRCCHYVERQVRRRRLALGAPSVSETPPDTAGNGHDLGLALRQALGRVSPKCQALLRSHYWEGRTLMETAERFSSGKAAISTLVSRCLDRLRRILEWKRR
jgi:RNA polymerase sigma factor (sigma-70 family)